MKHQSSSATLFDNQYTYNTASQISQITDLTNTRVFGYDLVDRLTSVHTNGTQTESYTFDDVGNRTASHLSASYGYQSGKFNQLTSTATASYQFDANGNTIQKSEGKDFWRYTWDYENRLTEASTRKEKVRYRYDALGRRVERNLRYSKDRTRFTHDGLDVVMDDDAETGITKYQNGLGIDDKLKLSNGGTASYFLGDHLGSALGLANTSASVTSSNSYDSFGNSTGNLASRYQFTGREFDSFSGLQFSRARFYDPKLGRFTSEDPIQLRAGPNMYSYVGNHPQAFSDPFGLFPSRWWFTWHQGITTIALEGEASQDEVNILNREQYDFDTETQDMQYAPMHAMSRPGQTPQSARDEANIFVRSQICLAKKLKGMGLESQALPYLSRAIHTLQTSTSPAHAGFQPAWSDLNVWHTDHYILESLVWPANAVLAKERTRAAYRYYKGNDGYPRLPDDFFPSSKFDWNSGPTQIQFPSSGPSLGGGSPCECQ